MKKQYVITALGAMLLASCADTWDRVYGEADPSIPEYKYLNDYAPLKEYKKNTNLKVSAALAADEFNKGELVYSLAKSNFEEIVAGNAMKMASCVDDKGNMTFDNVVSFVGNAEDAGLSVYGHTLAWHSQQPVKWLSSLIAPRPIEVGPDGMKEVEDYALECKTLGSLSWNGCPAEVTINYGTPDGIQFVNSVAIDPWYAFQYWLVSGLPLKNETTYNIKFLIKNVSDMNLSLNFKLGDWGGGAEKKISVEPGDDFQEVSFDVTATMDSPGIFLQNNSGWVGDYTIKSVTITHKEVAAAAKYWESVIDNGDMEGTDCKNFCTKSDQGSFEYVAFDGVGKDGTRGAKITSKGGYSDSWESQFWVVSNEVIPVDSKCKIKFDYRADGGCAGTSVDTQAHFGPGEYQHWSCAGSIAFTDQWQTYENTFTVDASMAGDNGLKSVAFNMSPNTSAGAYYIDNVSFEIEKENKEGIPLTPQEKKDTLTWAMNRWVNGMMQATEGKVKAWDLINEAIAGDGNVEGYYALQGAETSGGSWDVGGDKFYWQDYLGADEYGVIVEKAARDAYAAVEGANPADLKLFVNDYNLESDWDQNKKVKSLVYWVNKWEAKGKELGYNTKIDGLGTQMHISYYENPTTLANKKAAIQSMFKTMAETGKLVRISELDMGYVDANGSDMTTAQIHALPLEQRIAKEKAMADYYQWIIEQYKTIVPAPQQYGICQWCITDAPAASGWRGGEPVGLWTEGYQRKPAYAGWADGLAK